MGFIAAKALSFLPFGGLLRNPKVLIALIITGVLIFGVIYYKHKITKMVYNAVYTQQAEDQLEQQKQEFEKMQQIQNSANKQSEAFFKKKEKLLVTVERLRGQVRATKPEDDGTVSPVLTNALEQIRKLEKERNQIGIEKTGNSVIDEWKKKIAGVR